MSIRDKIYKFFKVVPNKKYNEAVYGIKVVNLLLEHMNKLLKIHQEEMFTYDEVMSIMASNEKIINKDPMTWFMFDTDGDLIETKQSEYRYE